MLWPIVAGMLDANDPAVVAVAHRPIACEDVPAVTCSGVLVAPRVVLTAAHCVVGMGSRGVLEVVFGPSAAQRTTEIVVQSFQVYSGYDANTGDGDLAVLLLAEPAPVAPVARPTATVDQLGSGAALRAVGFGVSSATAADPGTKRDGTLALGAVREASFDATPSPAMTCVADSGGPLFAGSDDQLVGVTSRGDAACMASAVNARVDVALTPFVDPAVAAGSNAAPGWPANLTAIDSACTADDDCPALMTCNEQGRCGLAWLGAGMFGAPCAAAGDCGGGARCVRVWPAGSDACHCFASSMTPPGGDMTAPPGGDVSGPAPGGGCGCASTDDGAPSFLLLVALAWAAQRVLLHARDQRRA